MMRKRQNMPLSILLLMAVSSVVYMPPPATASRSSSSPPSPGPVCAFSGAAPVVIGEAKLSFCGLSGASCCDAGADAVLREQFQALNVSDNPGCTATVKNVMCAKCFPSFSTETSIAADPGTVARSIPLLCARSLSPTSSSARRPSSGTRDPHRPPLCLERIRTAAGGDYVGMAAHPDGSSRVFLWTQDGKVSLASVPRRDSSRALRVDSVPFLDLTGRVLELLGVAFHREFATNGLFFVSYTCDSASPACGAAAGNGSSSSNKESRYLLVVSEFSSLHAARVDPSEMRRILFSMNLPLQHKSYSYQQHRGQILFPPTDGGDGYLYLIAGHGGDDDGYHSSNKITFYGKIIRFDVDLATSKPEIVAIGLNYPRGCSFDSERPSDLYCAGIDEKQNELVYLISSQYGNDYTGSSATAIFVVINHGRPAAGRQGTSIVGGLTSDGGPTDSSLKGRYVYVLGHHVWVHRLVGENGMPYSTRIKNIRCSGGTPVPCYNGAMGGSVLSLGEDNSKDIFFLSTTGIYRVVEPGLCTLAQPNPKSATDAYTWFLPSKAAGGRQQQTNPADDDNNNWFVSRISVAALTVFLVYVAYKKFMAACGGQPSECNSCWGSNIFWSSITYVNNNYVSADPEPRNGGAVSVEMSRLRIHHQ